MTSRRVAMVVGLAAASGGVAGVVGAVVAAAVIRPVGPAVALAVGPSARDTEGPVGTRDPHTDANRFHERIEAHQREPVDSSWAGEAHAAYEADFARFADDAGFRLISVDCGSTSCLAQLGFASFAEAKGSMQRIVLSRWTLNCAKAMSLDPATDGATEYVTSVYFDCARTSGASAGK